MGEGLGFPKLSVILVSNRLLETAVGQRREKVKLEGNLFLSTNSSFFFRISYTLKIHLRLLNFTGKVCTSRQPEKACRLFRFTRLNVTLFGTKYFSPSFNVFTHLILSGLNRYLTIKNFQFKFNSCTCGCSFEEEINYGSRILSLFLFSNRINFLIRTTSIPRPSFGFNSRSIGKFKTRGGFREAEGCRELSKPGSFFRGNLGLLNRRPQKQFCYQ